MKLCLPSIDVDCLRKSDFNISSMTRYTIRTTFYLYNHSFTDPKGMFFFSNRLQRDRFTSTIPRRGKMKWIEVKKWDSLGVMANIVK